MGNERQVGESQLVIRAHLLYDRHRLPNPRAANITRQQGEPRRHPEPWHPRWREWWCTIRRFSNQKLDRTIRDAVNQRTAAYNAGLLSGNMSEYKASCYGLRRAVRAAKLRYREIIESHFQLNDSRRMWQGLRTICYFGNKSSAEVRADPLLAEELNTFYGHFECNGSVTLPISASGSSRQSSDDHVITVSEDEVWRKLKRVNVRKAAGPDGISGRLLRSCADQLAGLFTSIFNESLVTSVVPTSFNKSVIIPVPKNSKPSCLNDYHPVALTSIVMKVFERTTFAPPSLLLRTLFSLPPLLLSNLLMILWFWASFPTMMRPHTWMR